MALVCEFDLVEDIFGISETEILGLPIDYSEACEIFIDTFLTEAQDRVPVDTGNLLNSITGDTDYEGQIRVEAGADYAQYVEFGTYKMPEQPYFTPACIIAQNEAMAAAQDAIDEAQEEEEEMLEEMGIEVNGGLMGLMGGPGGLGMGNFLGAAILGGIFMGIFNAILNIVSDVLTPGSKDQLINMGKMHISNAIDRAQSTPQAPEEVESYIRIE